MYGIEHFMTETHAIETHAVNIGGIFFLSFDVMPGLLLHMLAGNV